MIEIAAEPAFANISIGIGGGLPDFCLAKVGPIWIRITYSLDNAQMAFIEEGL